MPKGCVFQWQEIFTDFGSIKMIDSLDGLTVSTCCTYLEVGVVLF